MSRIGKNGFAFVDDDTEKENDNPKTFKERKEERIKKFSKLNECLNTFNEYSISSKNIIAKMSKMLL